MAKKGGEGFFSGGTQSIDLRDAGLDDDAPRGPRRGFAPKSRDDDDRPSPRGRGGGGGGAARPSSRGSGGAAGFGKGGGTAVVDTRDMDLDGGAPSSKRRGWSGGGGGGGRDSALGDPDLGRSSAPERATGKSGLGARRKSATITGEDGAELVAGFHEWQKGQSATSGGAARGAGGDEALARLEIREPSKEDRTFEIGPRQRSITVGREIANDVVLSDIKASRTHFEVSYLAGVFTLKDLGSGNGTKVNGEKVQRVELADGDVVTVGACSLTFRLDREALARFLDREHEVGPRAQREEEAEEEEPEEEVRLSPVAVLMVVGVFLAVLSLGVTFVLWLVFKPDAKRPSGAQVVELEEVPQEDPSVRQAVETTARGLAEQAEAANRAGKLWDARRYARVALLLDSSQRDARGVDAEVERSLKTRDSSACQVVVEPANPVRGRTMDLRVALGGPVSRISGSFAGEALSFNPGGQAPGEWVAQLKVPRGAARGPQNLELQIVDLMDETVDLTREVVVR